MRVLTDLKRQSSREGQVVLGAAVLDDLLGWCCSRCARNLISPLAWKIQMKLIVHLFTPIFFVMVDL